MFLNLIDIKKGAHERHIPLPLSNVLMTKSGLGSRFLRVDLYCEVRLDLVVCWRVVMERVLNLFQEQ